MKVCLIGVGKFGSIHKRVLKDIVGVELYTCDINGQEDARDWRILDFDHAIVCTPIDTHYDVVRRLLLQGKNVFVEKPLAKTVEECKELIEV